MPSFFQWGVAAGMKKFAYGENYIVNGPLGSIHAEHDALMRFMKTVNYKRSLLKVDILVVRFSKSGVMGNSRPCKNCLQRMKKITEKSILNIRNIYYSTEGDQIMMERFDEMIDSPMTYICSGMRTRERAWKFCKKK